MSATLIRNGRIITATDDYVADLLLDHGMVQTIGRQLAVGREGMGRFVPRGNVRAF